MAALARKSVICLYPKNFSLLYQSHVSLSLYFSTSVENQLKTPQFSNLLIKKYQFSPQTVASVLNRLKNPNLSDSTLSFLKETGFSNTQLEKLVKFDSRLLSTVLEESLQEKIKIFQEQGFSASDIAEIFTNNPSVLRRSVKIGIVPSLSVLQGLLKSDALVVKLLKKCGWFLVVDLEKTLVANVEVLKSFGASIEQIIGVLFNFPRFLLYRPEVMRKFVAKAEAMGADRSSRMFIHAARVVSSMTDKSFRLKLKAFRDMGFSDDHIRKLCRDSPIVLSVSVKKMKKIKEVLLETGKYDTTSIVSCPVSLMFSTEKRYKPRFKVLGVLEKKNLIKKWPSLGTLLVMSEEKFLKKFVAPYLNEVGEILIASGASNTRRRPKGIAQVVKHLEVAYNVRGLIPTCA